jgi:formate dehydrogenase subunit delta
MSGAQHLVDMANDIGNFFRAQPNRQDAIAGIAKHIKSYWTRRMREKLIGQLQHGDGGLDPLPREALRYPRASIRVTSRSRLRVATPARPADIDISCRRRVCMPRKNKAYEQRIDRTTGSVA